MSKSVPLTALWGILLLTGFILLGRGFPVKAGNDAAGQAGKEARQRNKGRTRRDKPGRTQNAGPNAPAPLEHTDPLIKTYSWRHRTDRLLAR